MDGTRKIGQGVQETARGIGKMVRQGADFIHDGAKAFGEAVWEGMKSVGRAVQQAF